MRKEKMMILKLGTVPNGAWDRHNGDLKYNGSSDETGDNVSPTL